jgi:DNA-3-methyladenine glycosylase II
VKQDPRLQPILKATGMPTLRKRDPGFAGLARIVVGQQLSTASANAIWNRLSVAYDPFHHDSIHRARAPRLAKLGLSAAKIKTLKLLAAEISSARLDLNALGELDADTAHKALVALHGVGPWTADVYLLFCLGHSDAWPAGDLALQDAVRAGLGLESRPTTKEMTALADVWRPYRGAAAHLWWAYYRVARRPAVPRQTARA